MTTTEADRPRRRVRRPAARRRARQPVLTTEESARAGKAARARAPRSAHAEHPSDPRRPDPVAVLQAQSAGRVADLVPIRYGRMLASPYAFFRGGAALMAADLAGTPTTGFATQLCGDAHIDNFGVYGSPERRLVFDLNDFDETERGPWEWDVKRLAASLEIAGRDNGYAAFQRERVVTSAVRGYRVSIRRLAALGHLQAWYEHVDLDDPSTMADIRLDDRARARAERRLAKARAHDSDRAVRKLTQVHDGRRRIVSDPPLVERLPDLLGDDERVDLEQRLDGILRAYRRTLPPDRRRLLAGYRRVDVARKVSGVGSVGTRCWVVLLAGRDDDDLLFLQMKEAGPSVLAPYVGRPRRHHHGRRVVLGQRQMQAVTDAFLGWQRTTGPDGVSRDFYVRQLADWKGGADIASMSADTMLAYGAACGRTLALAHARSGDRVALGSYLGSSDRFDRALATYAVAYADQNAADFERLRAAVADGRVTAVCGM